VNRSISSNTEQSRTETAKSTRDYISEGYQESFNAELPLYEFD